MGLNTLYALDLKAVDIVFLGLFAGLLVLLLVFFVIKKITDKKTEKVLQQEFNRLQTEETNNDNDNVEIEESVVEEKTEEPVVEEKAEEPVVEEKAEEPVVEEKAEEPVVEEKAEEPVVEEKAEEPVVEEKAEEPVVEEKAEEPVVEEKVEEPVVEEKAEEPVVEEKIEEPADGGHMEESKGRTYNGKFEVYQENNYYRYRLKASNGEVLFNSEIYATKDTALKSIGAVKRNIEKGKMLIIVDKNKNYKFKLVAANHRVLAISANYSTERGAQNALESFKRFAQTDDIVEITLPVEELDSALVEIPKNKEEDKKGGKFVLRKDLNGEFSWEFKANNGETLCKAAGYSNRNSLDTSIASFKESVKNGKFYIYRDKNDNYQFKLYNNGRLAMVGEGYTTNNVATDVVTSILNFIDLAVVSDRTVAPVKKTTTTKTTTTTKVTTKTTTKR